MQGSTWQRNSFIITWTPLQYVKTPHEEQHSEEQNTFTKYFSLLYTFGSLQNIDKKL